ncbi:hypothetical protein DSO57_1021090 [Entomophthora muscae]|uniref:Uncharacterized protein n=1 Tax=Entomophthora muscae TaxID=34485 RepID=A0ACC2TEQ3_9FUNG|nr:hypothetical protein DSO57_1021090 [Entomophthora muscae]
MSGYKSEEYTKDPENLPLTSLFRAPSLPRKSSPEIYHLPSLSEAMFVPPSDCSRGIPLDVLETSITTSKLTTEKITELGPRGRYAKLNVLLGKGAFKLVYKGLDRDEGYEVAWNCFQHASHKEYMELSSEIEILKMVRHPNIIAFHDCWYHNNESIFITELMTSGTLREFIHKLQIPNPKIVKRWSRQILKGLVYLHSYDPPIIHRDIKCDNIFINGAHGEVKIGDMGTAKMRLGKKYTVIGTPEFMAPEMYEEKGYNEKVDIYAFGMCLLEMKTGEYPYAECSNAAQVYKKVSQGLKPNCMIKAQDDPIVFGIITSCLDPEDKRPSAQELLNHSFLGIDPEVVLLSVESKNHLFLQVVFRGTDKLSVKFEFNLETDTAEEVVREMIDEQVLPQKFQHHITFEINRILRNLNRPTLEETSSMKENHYTWHKSNGIEHELDQAKRELALAAERASEAEKKAEKSELRARAAEERSRTGPLTSPTLSSSVPTTIDPPSHLSLSSGKNILMNAFKMLRGDNGQEPAEGSPPDLPTSNHSTHSSGMARRHTVSDWATDDEDTLINKEYADSTPIEEIVYDTASITSRSVDKANEWLAKLKNQDILTVGDLRDLHEEDWAGLGLTVFASRALRNCLRGRHTRSPNPTARRFSNMTPNSTIQSIENMDLDDSLQIAALSRSQ